jgi:hypothetical protein
MHAGKHSRWKDFLGNLFGICFGIFGIFVICFGSCDAVRNRNRRLAVALRRISFCSAAIGHTIAKHEEDQRVQDLR